MLARALRPDDRRGFWVDVGAGDPVVDSVTAAFAERGWRGVNVEPLPFEHERLCASVRLTRIYGSRSVRRPGWGRCSSSRLRSRAPCPRWCPNPLERYRADGEEFTPIEVPIWTLAQVVADHVAGPVDFLKVDVEGFEREVLAGADWSNFRPRVVVMEATVPKSDEPAHEAWEPMLLEVGYRFAMFDGLNRFYAARRRARSCSGSRSPPTCSTTSSRTRGAPGRPGTTVGTQPGGRAHPGATRTRPAVRDFGTRIRNSPLRRGTLCDRRRAQRYSVMTSTLRSCELRERLPKLTPVPPAPISEMTDSDDQLRHLLDCGYELAASHLEGINEAALELADAAGDDRRVMERVSRRRRTSAPRPKPCQQPGGFADPSRHRVGHVAVGLGQHPGRCRDKGAQPQGIE